MRIFISKNLVESSHNYKKAEQFFTKSSPKLGSNLYITYNSRITHLHAVFWLKTQ